MGELVAAGVPWDAIMRLTSDDARLLADVIGARRG